MISRRQAKRALEIHSDELSGFPNVVAVGVSRTGRQHRPASDADHAVAVYVSQKVPKGALDADGVLPGYVEIPGRGTTHKVAVEVIEIGEMEAQGKNQPGEQPGEHGATAFFAE
jgi:hypothetical protein